MPLPAAHAERTWHRLWINDFRGTAAGVMIPDRHVGVCPYP